MRVRAGVDGGRGDGRGPEHGDARDDVLRFEVLGPLRVLRGGAELDLGFPQARALLGLLLLRPGRPVGMSGIIDVLWPGPPPACAPNAVRRHVGALRRLLEPGLPPRAPGRRLLGRTGGYLLEAGADEVDVLRFRALTRRGMRAAATARPEQAVRHFTGALRLWRGPVAGGLPEPVRAHPRFAAVGREVLRTAQMAADAALLCGRADQVLPSLRRAVAMDPLAEPLVARLVLALAACGLQAEALAAYEAVRAGLAARLGVAPGAELAAAHARVLRQQVRPARRRVPAAPAEPVRPFVRPDQLPPGLPVFTGRETELAALDALFEEDSTRAVLISGPAGIGKTTLAVHWAHRAADRFPDGRLHLELGGSAARRATLDPAEALRRLLAALGVPARTMPTGVPALAARYREVLSDRRALVLLDDAACASRLRPLLPAAPGCLTLITSRSPLLPRTRPPATLQPTDPRPHPVLLRTDPRPRSPHPPTADVRRLSRDLRPTPGTRPLPPDPPATANARLPAPLPRNPPSTTDTRPLPPDPPTADVRPLPPDPSTADIRPLPLDLPTVADARALLARRIGAARVAAEPAAAEEIIQRCGRLPLALALVAARAVSRPEFPLGALAADLADLADPVQEAEPFGRAR
ncbi:BTAD domain-containing putative transcriptional regulator [Streptomyces cinerochromogenes]|uniref:AfsR/SARP family transcriptional regulator n=1 Tax=Streptomyces cinerochromogenes TaxID=66422 RepID=UPI0036B08183